MDLEIKDKIAIVTGGASGIGKATALVLADEGCDVAIVDLSAEKAQRVVDEIKSKERSSIALEADIASSKEVKKACEKILDKYGSVDFLCSIAGHANFGPVEYITDNTWNRMLSVHLTGTFNFIREIVPVMKKRKQGKIVNMASDYGMRAEALWSAYCSAKAGVMGFTKALARELAPFNINVNAIAPGKVATEMALKDPSSPYEETVKSIPLRRYASPEEIGYLFAFLCSDKTAGFITGQIISPNGGRTIVGI